MESVSRFRVAPDFGIYTRELRSFSVGSGCEGTCIVVKTFFFSFLSFFFIVLATNLNICFILSLSSLDIKIVTE